MDESTLFFSLGDPSLMCARLVIITSDEEHIVDDVRLHPSPCLWRVFTDKFPGAQRNSC